MGKTSAIEIILRLNAEVFKASVKSAGNTVKQMGGVMDTSLRKTRTAFRNGLRGVQAYRKEIQRLDTNANSLKSTLGQVIGMVGGGFLLAGAGRSAVDFNSTIEQSQIGLAALVRTFNEFPAGVGSYKASMSLASDIQRQLQIEGLKTVATYKQLLVALQEGAGPAFKRGFNPAQVVRFTSLMTQAAAAISLPMDQLGQEIRSILDGTIDRNSRVAKTLGITNEKIKEMAASGKLFEYLEERLKEFAQAGDDMAKTWTGAWSNMMDAIQMGLGTGLEDSFGSMRKFFLDLRDVIVDIDEEAGEFTFNKRLMAALESADQAISSFIASITKEDMEKYLVLLAETISGVIEVLVLFLKTMKELVDAIGPAIPLIAKFTTGFLLFGGALKALVGLPLLIGKQILGLNAAFTAMTGINTVGWLTKLRSAFTFAEVAALGFRGIIGGLAGVIGAAVGGWQLGTWLYNQSDIVKKAGNRIAATFTKIGLKVKQAWAWVTGGDTAAVQREIDEAERIYDELYNEIGQGAKEAGKAHTQVAVKAKESAKMQSKNQKEATEEMKKAYKSYADEVKRLQDDIAGRERSLAEQLREMDRSGMSEAGAWVDRKKEAEEFASAAREAAEAARQAFAAGDEETGSAKYEEAVSYYDKARQAAADLNKEVRSGDKVIQSQAESLKKARPLVEEYGKAGIELQKEFKDAITKAADAINKQSGGALAEEMPEVAKAFGQVNEQAEDLAGKSAEFNSQWNDAWDDFLKTGGEAIYDLDHKLSQLTKDRHIKVYVTEVTKKALGGIIGTAQRMASGGAVAFRNMLGGGFFPGFGGGDRRHVIAEDGEYMFDKFITRLIGLEAMQTLHAGRIRDFIAMAMERFNIDPREIFSNLGQRMSLGGIVGRISLPILPPPQMLAGGGVVAGEGRVDSGHFTIDLSFPGLQKPARVQTDRETFESLRRYAEKQNRLRMG